MPASLAAVAQQQAPSAETLAELAAVQPEKREAFDHGASGWVTWNTGYTALYTSTTSTAAIPLNSTWGSWNVTYSGTSGNAMIYDANSNVAIPSGGSFTISTPQWTYWNEQAEETEEQRARREAEQAARAEERERERAEWQRRYDEQQKVRLEAEDRARALLRSLLSDEQWASYEGHGWFEVRGRSGRRWRIRDRGQSGNIDLMPEIGEERDATYCAHPPEGLPDADAHAAQMLALVTDDEAFLRVANRHWRRPPAEPVPAVMQEAA